MSMIFNFDINTVMNNEYEQMNTHELQKALLKESNC